MRHASEGVRAAWCAHLIADQTNPSNSNTATGSPAATDPCSRSSASSTSAPWLPNRRTVKPLLSAACFDEGALEFGGHAAFAPERQRLVVTALAAAQPQETVGQDAALEEGVELVLDAPRQFTARAGLNVRDEAGGVLLHKPIQRGLLGAMALVVELGAIRRHLGLPADGPHARLPK